MIFEIIVGLFAFLLAGFSIVIFMVKRFAKPTVVNKDYNFEPKVSIVIPTKNEESFIEKRIENIQSMGYPPDKLEVLFIDNSTDNTAKIIQGYSEKFPFFKVLKQEKPGFNNALNQGYSAASGEIIIKSDCTALPHPDALREIVSNFADNSVGAVTGIHEFNGERDGVECEFKGVMYKVQLMESYLHSSLISHGSFGAYRKSLVPVLGEEITADDSEVVVNVVRKGYRAIVDEKVKSEEEAPVSFRERRSQKNRRAAGVIRVILKNIDMAFNGKFGRFGWVTIPVELFILVLAPLVFFFLLIFLSLFILSAFSLFFAVLAPAALILVLIGFKFSSKFQAIVDTYFSCFFGLFHAFSKKKTWK